MTFLYVAYTATWAIHIGYLVTVAVRYRRLNREIEDMGHKDQ